MAAPSLYSYFGSKEAIYDAMFAQGYREFLELARQPGSDLRDELRLRTRDYLRAGATASAAGRPVPSGLRMTFAVG